MDALTSIGELAGLVAIVVGATLLAAWLGWIVAGLLLCLLCVAMSPARPPSDDS